MITCAIGQTGSGKTWLITRLIRKQWLKNETVYPNYPMSFDEQNTGIIRWNALSETYHLKNGVIAIDEGQKLFHARRWAELPLFFIDKITQHRKHKVDIFTTTQDLGQIDIDIRKNIHKLYTCVSIWRFPSDDKVKPIIHLIKVYRSKRLFTLDTNAVRWVDVGWPRYYAISRYWTKEFYDTYGDIGMSKLCTKLTCDKTVKSKFPKWVATIQSNEIQKKSR